MDKHPTHKSESGFTLIEMLIVIAIIGILASVAIPQYSQYKIRGYDAQTKQALKNMHLLCNAYWLDTSALQGCDLPKIKEPTYGLNQNTDVVATLPPSPRDNFCASAKHNDSPNTFSIDSAALISSGAGCANKQVAAVGTIENYKPPEIANSGIGSWVLVDSNGKQIRCSNGDLYKSGVMGKTANYGLESAYYFEGEPVLPKNGTQYNNHNCNDGLWDDLTLAGNNFKFVYEKPAESWTCCSRATSGMTYNFSTNTWTLDSGEEYDTNGNIVE